VEGRSQLAQLLVLLHDALALRRDRALRHVEPPRQLIHPSLLQSQRAAGTEDLERLPVVCGLRLALRPASARNLKLHLHHLLPGAVLLLQPLPQLTPIGERKSSAEVGGRLGRG
jgi:hypothetical protein